VDGKSWGELAANYAIWRGRLWPAVLATVVIAPFLWARRHDRELPAVAEDQPSIPPGAAPGAAPVAHH
jgi:hypothetical protein